MLWKAIQLKTMAERKDLHIWNGKNQYLRDTAAIKHASGIGAQDHLHCISHHSSSRGDERHRDAESDTLQHRSMPQMIAKGRKKAESKPRIARIKLEKDLADKYVETKS